MEEKKISFYGLFVLLTHRVSPHRRTRLSPRLVHLEILIAETERMRFEADYYEFITN